MKIHNSLGRELQEFKPIEEGKVRFYQCGPTVYSRQHIGNLSSAVRGDLIRKSLEYLSYKVNFVRNVTDVGHLTGENEGNADLGEDKLSKGARKEGKTPEEISNKYTDLYHKDLEKLNVKKPTYETFATSFIKEMGEMVQELINKDFAYATDLAIYFDISKYSDYTQLSGQKLEMNKSGAGHGDVLDSKKRNPQDFAVWFFKTGTHKNALQTWNYEFENIEQSESFGFPGWHIECSAMAKSKLGDTIDIHMGGIEHIPVHHTNEIAQSECANGVKFANYWIHHELLEIDGGKMSKSLGNVYSIDDLEEKGYSALDYRYFLLGAHYRSKQNFTWEALEAAKNARERLIRQLKNLWDDDRASLYSNIKKHIDKSTKAKFTEHLENDFNISAALSVVFEVLKSDISNESKLATILDFDKVLGLGLENSLQKQKAEYSPEVQSLIDLRTELRQEKKYQEADEIRDRLKNQFGVEVRDK